MRLLVINWQDPENPRAGGAEVHLREVFGRLAARGHEVVVLASGWPGCELRQVVAGLEIHRVGGRHSFALRAPYYYRHALAARRFDVIVEDLNKIPCYAPAWADRPVVLLVHHLFGSSAFRAASFPIALATWTLEHTLRAYAGVPTQAVSESTAEELCRHGLRQEDVTVIHNGVTTEPAEFGVTARAPDPTFLYVGRLQPYKRVDLILRALALVRQRLPHARLIVAGRGDDEARLTRLARSLRLDSCVEFAGFVGEAKKQELLRTAWIHVVTSAREGWGLSVLEAAAAGTPTVASASPGLRDAVRDGLTGVLVPHGDVVALADALTRLAGDPEYVDALGHAARRQAEQTSWERAAGETEAHLEAVVSGKIGIRGNPLRCKRRDQRSHVPLPRNSRGVAPYGCTAFTVEARTSSATIRWCAYLASRDLMGEEPMLLIGEVPSPLPLTRLPERFTIVEPLHGWPVDSSAFVRERVGRILGPEWEVDVCLGLQPLRPNQRARRVAPNCSLSARSAVEAP